MTLQEEAQQIQDYLDIECSENPEEVLERIRAIMPYISRTAFMLAEAKKALRRKKATEISNTIINIAKEQCFIIAKSKCPASEYQMSSKIRTIY